MVGKSYTPTAIARGLLLYLTPKASCPCVFSSKMGPWCRIPYGVLNRKHRFLAR